MEVIKSKAAQDAPEYNEAEIRFHIVDPILRRLGYDESEDAYLLLEDKLEYPYVHIGRRSKKDVPLGIPDYRAGLKGARGSFVVEAKAGNISITPREIEQGHSYAAHSQVGANYYVLCNGMFFEIFETLSGANSEPLVRLSLSEINEKFYKIENILSPENLRRNCKIKHDMRLKLSDGLRSSVFIRSGLYLMSNYSYRILINGQDLTEQLKFNYPNFSMLDEQLEKMKTDFELRVSDGFVERGEDGRIIAQVEFKGITKHNDSVMKLLCIDKLQFETSEKFISVDSNNPTMFESIKVFSLSRGINVSGMFGEVRLLSADIDGDVFVKSAMYVNGRNASGQYTAFSKQNHKISLNRSISVEMQFSGTFDLTLDV